jgi:type II secretory pathway pseudopilin PulG
MIVIAIIAILAAALYPSLTSYLARGRDSTRVTHLRSISTALASYASDHAGAYPASDA